MTAFEPRHPFTEENIMTTPLSRALPTDRLPHGFQVLATVLLTGALFAIGWALSEAGLLDLAATGLAFFVVTFARQMGVGLSSRAPKEFAGSAKIIDQIRADWTAWIAHRTVLSRALIATVMTVGFLLLRAAITGLLTVIASPWVALAAGLAISAAVASPVLMRALIETIGGGSGRAETVEEASPR